MKTVCKKTTAYLYKWTQLSTKKWYVGCRTGRGCNVNDGYICSSKVVKPLIKENSNDWVRTILAIGDPSYIVDLEVKYLQKLDAKNDPMSFNMHNGDGNFSMTGKRGGRAGKTPWNKGRTKENTPSMKGGVKKGNIPWNKGIKSVHTPWNKGIKTGQTPWNKGLPKEEQPFYNRTHSAETKQKLSLQKQGENNPMYGKTPWNKL